MNQTETDHSETSADESDRAQVEPFWELVVLAVGGGLAVFAAGVVL